MCQPKQPPSPADKQKEALDDVERIARELYGAFSWLDSRGFGPWEEVGDDTRSHYRVAVRRLLEADVIRIGKRPNVERPLEGQTRLDDYIDYG